LTKEQNHFCCRILPPQGKATPRQASQTSHLTGSSKMHHEFLVEVHQENTLTVELLNNFTAETVAKGEDQTIKAVELPRLLIK
jgi:hypothetical protein